MSTILDVPGLRDRVMKWTVEGYESLAGQGLLPRNVELLRGIVVEKMSKSPLHREIAKELYDLISSALPAGFIVYQEAPLKLADSEPEPDIAIVRGARKDFHKRHPSTAALVIEVAVSSAALERANAALYAEAGVEEYWIVLGGEGAVEVYTAPVSGAYTQRWTVDAGEILVSSAVPPLKLPLTAVFAPLAD